MTLINPFKSGGANAPSVGLTSDAKDSVTQWSFQQYLAVLVAAVSAQYTTLSSLLARAGLTPLVVTSNTLARPGDTTAYASGDLVANNATAGSVTPFTLTVARITGGLGQVRRMRLKKSGTSVTNAAFYVHLFNVAPTVANGDNGAFSPSGAAGYVGAFSVASMIACSDGAVGVGAPLVGNEATFAAATGSQNLYALIEARAAYTPANAEAFTLTAEVAQA